MGYFNLGTLYDQQQQHKQAIVQYRQVTLLAPSYAPAWYNLGGAFYMLGQFDDAATNYEKATTIDPNYVFAHANLAAVYVQQGRLEEAKQHHMKSIAISPLFADAWMNLGNVIKAMGDTSQAMESYLTAIHLNPRHSSAYFNLGVAHWELGNLDDAIAAYQTSIELAPTFANSYFNLALCYQKLGQAMRPNASDIALQLFRSATELQPLYHEAYNNLGTVLEQMHRTREAVAAYTAALAISDADSVFANLFHAMQVICDWRAREFHLGRLQQIIHNELSQPRILPSIHPLHALSLPLSATATMRIARRQAAAEAPMGEPLFSLPRLVVEGGGGGAIRVGLLSAELGRLGAPSRLLTALVALHSPRIQIFVYCSKLDVGDARETIMAAVDGWTDLPAIVTPENTRSTAEKISADGVHVLLHVHGHSGKARNAVYAFSPAPIQLLLFGHFGSFGADYVRFVLSDRIATPPELAEHFSEALVLLSSPLLPPVPPGGRRPPSHTRSELLAMIGLDEAAVRTDPIVFCAPTLPWRLSPEMFDTWARILRRTPNSILWFPQFSEEQEENILREALARGIAASNIILGPSLANSGINPSLWIEREAVADIMLDTGPYVADGMWTALAAFAQVPVISFIGDRMAARMAASTVRGRSVGLVRSLEEYEHVAVHLAQQVQQQRSRSKQELQQENATPPLSDKSSADSIAPSRATREEWVAAFEQAVGLLWDTWSAQRASWQIVAASSQPSSSSSSSSH